VPGPLASSWRPYCTGTPCRCSIRNSKNYASTDENTSRSDLEGSLDLHADAGQRALRAAGLLSQFLAVARRGEAEETRLLRVDGSAVTLEELVAGLRSSGMEEKGSREEKMEAVEAVKQNEKENEDESEVQGRPEIDRTALKQLLTDALPEGSVSWGCRVDSVEPVVSPCGSASSGVDGLETTKWRINFSKPGTDSPDATQGHEKEEEQVCDLVVGADGAWSRARAQLTPIRPLCSGIVALDLRVDHLDSIVDDDDDDDDDNDNENDNKYENGTATGDQTPGTAAFVGRGSCGASCGIMRRRCLRAVVRMRSSRGGVWTRRWARMARGSWDSSWWARGF
jgi:hypothetical protein